VSRRKLHPTIAAKKKKGSSSGNATDLLPCLRFQGENDRQKNSLKKKFTTRSWKDAEVRWPGVHDFKHGEGGKRKGPPHHSENTKEKLEE